MLGAYTASLKVYEGKQSLCHHDIETLMEFGLRICIGFLDNMDKIHTCVIPISAAWFIPDSFIVKVICPDEILSL